MDTVLHKHFANMNILLNPGGSAEKMACGKHSSHYLASATDSLIWSDSSWRMVNNPELGRSRYHEISTEKRATGVCQTGCKGTRKRIRADASHIRLDYSQMTGHSETINLPSEYNGPHGCL